MAKGPEARLQRRIRDSLEKEFGGFWWKNWAGPFSRTGLPDLMGVVRGLFIGIEVKTPKGVTSDIQYATIKRIRKEGGIAAIVTTADEAIEYLRLASIRPIPKKRSRLRPKREERRSIPRAGQRKNVDTGRHHRTFASR